MDLERERHKSESMGKAARPIDYLRCGEGHTWLLVQFDGLRALIQYCATKQQQPEDKYTGRMDLSMTQIPVHESRTDPDSLERR
jgi:hypothetical protein